MGDVVVPTRVVPSCLGWFFQSFNFPRGGQGAILSPINAVLWSIVDGVFGPNWATLTTSIFAYMSSMIAVMWLGRGTVFPIWPAVVWHWPLAFRVISLLRWAKPVLWESLFYHLSWGGVLWFDTKRNPKHFGGGAL